MTAETDHPCFPQPTDPGTTLWRYMSLRRFQWLVRESSLYFPRADHLGDPFEGSLPCPNVEQRRALVESGLFTENAVEEWAQLTELAPRWTYVSCWHRSTHESAAMWRLYGDGTTCVAVRTTYLALACVLPDEAMLGEVEYVDYRREIIPSDNALYPFMHKRDAFKHEQEVRAVILRAPPGEPDDGVDLSRIPTPIGLRVPVDLDQLLDGVVLAPGTERRDVRTVAALVDSIDGAVLEESILGDSPQF